MQFTLPEAFVVERRELPRVPLLYYLAVFERNTDELVGYLADITPVGALILSDNKLEPEKVYPLKLEYFSVIDGTKTFDLDGRCVRSSFDETLAFYKNGFQFTEISSEHMHEISSLIDTYRFTPDTSEE